MSSNNLTSLISQYIIRLRNAKWLLYKHWRLCRKCCERGQTNQQGTVPRSNRSSVVDAFHWYWSHVASRPCVWYVCQVFLCVTQKHLCGGSVACEEEHRKGQLCCALVVLPSQPPQPCLGWNKRGEECVHVNSYNAELCSILTGTAPFSALHHMTVTNSSVYLVFVLIFFFFLWRRNADFPQL